MDLFPTEDPARKSIVTRLMIAADYRRTNLAFRLFSECYTIGLMRGTKLNFMDCNDHLVEFFKGIGYRDYVGRVVHEEYGEVTPMYLDLQDVDYLKMLKSPYIKAYDRWLSTRPTDIDPVDLPLAGIPAVDRLVRISPT